MKQKPKNFRPKWRKRAEESVRKSREVTALLPQARDPDAEDEYDEFLRDEFGGNICPWND